jgi:nitrate reductase alpha subunit
MTYHGLHAAPQRFVAPDPEIWTSDIEPGIAYTPFKHHVEQKKPWRTLVGRQQFYIDHDWNRDIKVEIEKYKGVPPTQA